mgnify:CR=1 FL=1
MTRVREDFAEILKLVRPSARVLDLPAQRGAIYDRAGRALDAGYRFSPDGGRVVRVHDGERLPRDDRIEWQPARG